MTVYTRHKYNVYYYLPNGEVVLHAFNQSLESAVALCDEMIDAFRVRADKEQPINS